MDQIAARDATLDANQGGKSRAAPYRPRFAMEIAVQRNNLLPWYIGLIIIIIADGYLLAFRTDEGAAELAQQSAMVAIPIVALGLMFLMFRSQR